MGFTGALCPASRLRRLAISRSRGSTGSGSTAVGSTSPSAMAMRCLESADMPTWAAMMRMASARSVGGLSGKIRLIVARGLGVYNGRRRVAGSSTRSTSMRGVRERITGPLPTSPGLLTLR